jgi:hypothetical protein
MEAHVKVVLQDIAYGPMVQLYVMLRYDCVFNLFQRPDIFVIVLEVLDCAYCCCKFSFFRGLFFKQFSLVVLFVFEVTNNLTHCLSCSTILYSSRLVC